MRAEARQKRLGASDLSRLRLGTERPGQTPGGCPRPTVSSVNTSAAPAMEMNRMGDRIVGTIDPILWRRERTKVSRGVERLIDAPAVDAGRHD